MTAKNQVFKVQEEKRLFFDEAILNKIFDDINHNTSPDREGRAVAFECLKDFKQFLISSGCTTYVIAFLLGESLQFTREDEIKCKYTGR